MTMDEGAWQTEVATVLADGASFGLGEMEISHPRDTQAVIDLWSAVSPSAAPHNDPATAIRKKLAVDRDLLLVAEAGGAIVGTVMGGYDGHRGWVYSVAVHVDHRRRGIGSALLRRIETALVDRGCLKVNLQVVASNPEAVAFYETLGYSVEERVSMGKRLYQP